MELAATALVAAALQDKEEGNSDESDSESENEGTISTLHASILLQSAI